MSTGACIFVSFGILLNAGVVEGDDRHTQLLRRFLEGDASVRAELESGPIEAIVALESHLLVQGNRDLSVQEVRQLISQLADDDFQVRETATDRLQWEGAAHRDLLEAALKESKDTEVAYRLKQVLANLINSRETNRRRVPLILQTLYKHHLDTVATDYFMEFEKDLHDRRALLFFEHTHPDELSAWTEKLSRPARLCYLLSLLFVEHDAVRNTEIFEGYTGEEIRVAAGETFWPVEIHPPILDGAYHWTVRAAKVEGRRASHVMRMSIEKRYKTGQMKHIQSWPQWDYLFRFKAAYLRTYHGIALMTTHTGYLRAENVLRIPSGVEVPVAEVNYKEQRDWSLGKNFQWARPIYPVDVVDRVDFRESPHRPHSKIVTPWRSAAP